MRFISVIIKSKFVFFIRINSDASVFYFAFSILYLYDHVLAGLQRLPELLHKKANCPGRILLPISSFGRRIIYLPQIAESSKNNSQDKYNPNGHKCGAKLC